MHLKIGPPRPATENPTAEPTNSVGSSTNGPGTNGPGTNSPGSSNPSAGGAAAPAPAGCAWQSYGMDTVCRRGKDDYTVTGGETTEVLYAATLPDCEKLCADRATCTGVEFRHDQFRCEVWSQPIGEGRAGKDVVSWRYTGKFECVKLACDQPRA